MPAGFEPDDTVRAGPAIATLPRGADFAAPCGRSPIRPDQRFEDGADTRDHRRQERDLRRADDPVRHGWSGRARYAIRAQ